MYSLSQTVFLISVALRKYPKHLGDLAWYNQARPYRAHPQRLPTLRPAVLTQPLASISGADPTGLTALDECYGFSLWHLDHHR